MEPPPPASTSSSPLPSSSFTTALIPAFNQTPKNGKKRKSHSQLALLHKRIRQYLITCPVARSILRDLGLRSRSTLNSGKFLAWTVDHTEPVFQTIHKYVFNGQPGIQLSTFHPRRFGIKVVGILRITPGGIPPPQFSDNPKNKGELRMMLWKGGRAIDQRNSIKNGLKLRKQRVYKYWGEGYYFSDRIEEALDESYDMRYYMDGEERTDVFREGNVHYLFLCEVLLGKDMYLTYTRELDGPVVTPKEKSWWERVTGKEPGKVRVESIKCGGQWNPDPKGDQEIDGCVWRLGESFCDKRADSLGDGFWANRYIVYDESRVIVKYLVKVEITKGTVKEIIC